MTQSKPPVDRAIAALYWITMAILSLLIAVAPHFQGCF